MIVYAIVINYESRNHNKNILREYQKILRTIRMGRLFYIVGPLFVDQNRDSNNHAFRYMINIQRYKITM